MMEFAPLLDPADADDLSPEELRRDIAILSGVLAHKTGVQAACAALLNIAIALQGGGRA